MSDDLLFALNVTGPILGILLLGVALRRIGLITEAFIDTGSRVVFNVGLPSLLFITICETDFSRTLNVPLILVGVLGTLGAYLLLELLAAWLVQPRADRGVVVQGSYRANMGIVGLAYSVNAYGDIALAVCSLYLALVTILYNILAVITLNRAPAARCSLLPLLGGIVRNPLIIGIIAALPVAYLGIPLPQVLLRTGDYFAQMTLPLALLCIGASLSRRALHLDSRNAALAVTGKLLVYPLIISLSGYMVGLRNMELGLLFLMSAAPTAASSFVMSRAMGANAALAANIVVLSTMGSVVVTSLGITAMRAGGMM